MKSPIRMYLSSLPRFGLISLAVVLLAAGASVMAYPAAERAHSASDDQHSVGTAPRS